LLLAITLFRSPARPVPAAPAVARQPVSVPDIADAGGLD
jgi:hypothetical protein